MCTYRASVVVFTLALTLVIGLGATSKRQHEHHSQSYQLKSMHSFQSISADVIVFTVGVAVGDGEVRSCSPRSSTNGGTLFTKDSALVLAGLVFCREAGLLHCTLCASWERDPLNILPARETTRSVTKDQKCG